MSKRPLDWVAAGKPRTKAWSMSRGYYWTIPPIDGQTVMCSPSQELQMSPIDREEFYEAKPGCRKATEARAPLQYSKSAGGFIGKGMTAPGDAAVLKYSPPKIPVPSSPAPSNIAPNRPTIQPFQPTGDSVNRYSTLGAGVGTTIGGPLGGIIGGGIGGLIGGKSRCPGPFNYNPVTGGCDPKPGTGFAGGGQQTGNCPAGSHWDGTGCKKDGAVGVIQDWLPGGQTGYVEGGAGFYQTPYGFARDPEVVMVERRNCGRGMILGSDGKCYHKGNPKKGTGITNQMRMHPKPPRPIVSAGDAKTLRKIDSIRKRAKRAAQTAGFKGMKL